MSRITTVPVSAYPLTCLLLSVDISLQLTRRVPWSSRIESPQEMKNKKEISLRFVVFHVGLFQLIEVFPHMAPISLLLKKTEFCSF